MPAWLVNEDTAPDSEFIASWRLGGIFDMYKIMVYLPARVGNGNFRQEGIISV